jgi:hypothetical protein
VPTGDAPHPAKAIDLIMPAMLGGRQRSENELRGLLAGAGFALHRIVDGSGSYSALEAALG